MSAQYSIHFISVVRKDLVIGHFSFFFAFHRPPLIGKTRMIRVLTKDTGAIMFIIRGFSNESPLQERTKTSGKNYRIGPDCAAMHSWLIFYLFVFIFLFCEFIAVISRITQKLNEVLRTLFKSVIESPAFTQS